MHFCNLFFNPFVRFAYWQYERLTKTNLKTIFKKQTS